MKIGAFEWIPTLDGRYISFEEMVYNPQSIAASPLTEAAITRWLIAITHNAAKTSLNEVLATAENITLFGDHPFLQDPRWQALSDDDDALKNPSTLEFFNAGKGPALLSHHHDAMPPQPVATPVAVQNLLVRQAFAPGGLLPVSRKRFGAASGSSQNTPGNTRPMLWVQAHTMAETLRLNVVPAAPTALMWSWPTGTELGTRQTSTGPSTGLTYLARSAHLRGNPDQIHHVVVANGLVYGDHNDPETLPHSVYLPGKKDTVATVGATTRPGVITRLLGAWQHQHGLLGHLAQHPAEHRKNWVLRYVGLATYQSRIDGTMDITMPCPVITPEEAGTFTEQLSLAWKNAMKNLRRMFPTTAGYSTQECYEAVSQIAHGGRQRHTVDVIASAVAAGTYTVAEGIEQIHAALTPCGDDIAPYLNVRANHRAIGTQGVTR